MSLSISLTINGLLRTVAICDPRVTLLDLLRRQHAKIALNQRQYIFLAPVAAPRFGSQLPIAFGLIGQSISLPGQA